MAKFAILGVAGYVARRHLEAIRSLGHQLVLSVDPHDSVGILDGYFPDTQFVTRVAHFEQILRERQSCEELRVDFVSICTPNDLHAQCIRLALEAGADAICEKPIVFEPRQLDDLRRLELSTGRRVYTILQLRYHPAVTKLYECVQAADPGHVFRVKIDYVTPRGDWYQKSWKGDLARSGGLLANIGIHLFDLLLWLFGPPIAYEIDQPDFQRADGTLVLERARVEWRLSLNRHDLPESSCSPAISSLRSIEVDGDRIDLAHGFENLHTQCYRMITEGHGLGIDDASPSVELTAELRRSAGTNQLTRQNSE